MTLKSLLLAFNLLLLAGCSGSDSPASSTTPVTTPPVTIPAQGARILGMDVKDIPSVPYASAYQLAMDMGVREVSVSLDWVSFENVAGNYIDPFNILPAIDSFYPFQVSETTLVLRPLDTPGPRLPTDLSALPYDDPAVITAFENFLFDLHSKLPNLNASGKLTRIQIGNEIDAYLGSDATRWAQWQTFFNAAKAKIISLWGTGVEVGSVVEYSVLLDAGKRTQYLNFLAGMDSATLTYYPLQADFTMRPPSTVTTDFDFIVNTIPNKPIVFQECGYPSSTINNSSEALQTDFISAVFEAWDTHRDRITLIDLAWQYDVSPTSVDQWVIDFGMSGQPTENAFKAYLGTLGFSNFDSSEKPALQRIKDELTKRRWTK